MISTVNVLEKSVTLTFSDVEWAILVRARQKCGPSVLDDAITLWIEERLRRFRENDGEAFVAKYESLDATKRAQVDALLNQ